LRVDRYKSHIPEQRQLAFTNGPISIADQTFPAQTFFNWTSVAPRVGAIYDIDGEGRTVLKLNYGLFMHNPGPGIAASGNPNQASKTVTREWNDLNGNRVWDPGEEGALVATALAGTISVDSDIRQPYTHEASAFLEREVMANLGVRLGVVYKTEDDDWFTLQPNRPIDAYTVPFNVSDPGLDGIAGNADDRVLTLLGLPRSQLSQFPATNVIMNGNAFGRHTTAEIAATKRFSSRWSAQAGFGQTWSHGQGVRRTPNDPDEADETRWSFKASGIYQAPWDIRITPVFRHQAGSNYGRTLSVTAAAATGAFYSATIRIEPQEANRQDHINVFDLRAEKTVRLRGASRARLFLDCSTSPTAPRTGTRLGFPTNILGPRTARVGFRFDW